MFRSRRFSVKQHHNDWRDESIALLHIRNSQRLCDVFGGRLIGLVLIPDHGLRRNVSRRIAGRNTGIPGLGQHVGLALRITGDIRRVHDANLSTRVHSLLRSGVIRLLGILAGILVGVLIILLRVGRRIGIGCVRLIAGSGVGLGLGLALAALALFRHLK